LVYAKNVKKNKILSIFWNIREFFLVNVHIGENSLFSCIAVTLHCHTCYKNLLILLKKITGGIK
jgi:hypothetical protein